MKFIATLVISLALFRISYSQLSQELEQQPFLRKYLEDRPEFQRRILIGDDCVKWYKNTGYNGDATTKCGSIKEVGDNWKNKYSSVKLGSNVEWVKAYSSKKWGGNSAFITADTTNLGDINGVDLQNDIQSFSVSTIFDDDCVRFWEDENLNGDSWTVCSTDNSIPGSRQGRYNYVQFGSKTKKLYLFGNTYFSNIVSSKSDPGTTQNLKAINSNFKSFEIQHDNLPDGCVWLYSLPGYASQGGFFELCHSYSDLGFYQEQVSSFRLGDGVARIRLYDNTGYTGDYKQYTSDQFNGLGSWDNKAKSIVLYSD